MAVDLDTRADQSIRTILEPSRLVAFLFHTLCSAAARRSCDLELLTPMGVELRRTGVSPAQLRLSGRPWLLSVAKSRPGFSRYR